jgi:hypothetical protein
MRRTGGHGRNACVTRVATDGYPGLERSKDSAAQWPHWACAQQDCVAQWAEGRVTALRGVPLALAMDSLSSARPNSYFLSLITPRRSRMVQTMRSPAVTSQQKLRQHAIHPVVAHTPEAHTVLGAFYPHDHRRRFLQSAPRRFLQSAPKTL